MANSKWNPVDCLPDELDVTQAEVYREAEPQALGGRHLVFPDQQVWWERPDGQYQYSVYGAGAFTGPQWERVDA